MTAEQREIAALRALIHQQARRWTPGLSRDEVERMIVRAVEGPELDPNP